MSYAPTTNKQAREIWIEAQAAWRLGAKYHVEIKPVIGADFDGVRFNLRGGQHGMGVTVSPAFAVRLTCRAINLVHHKADHQHLEHELLDLLGLDVGPTLCADAMVYRTTGTHVWKNDPRYNPQVKQ